MILVLFTVPFYHFLFLRYLVLAERHFSSDILVPIPDSSNLYSRVIVLFDSYLATSVAGLVYSQIFNIFCLSVFSITNF